MRGEFGDLVVEALEGGGAELRKQDIDDAAERQSFGERTISRRGRCVFRTRRASVFRGVGARHLIRGKILS